MPTYILNSRYQIEPSSLNCQQSAGKGKQCRSATHMTTTNIKRLNPNNFKYHTSWNEKEFSSILWANYYCQFFFKVHKCFYAMY